MITHMRSSSIHQALYSALSTQYSVLLPCFLKTACSSASSTASAISSTRAISTGIASRRSACRAASPPTTSPSSSAAAFGERNGAIHYYAEKTRAGTALPPRPAARTSRITRARTTVYYRVALGDLQPQRPAGRQRHQTRDQLHLYHLGSLRPRPDDCRSVQRERLSSWIAFFTRCTTRGLNVSRTWDAEQRSDEFAPGLRILCDNGSSVIASTRQAAARIFWISRRAKTASFRRFSRRSPATAARRRSASRRESEPHADHQRDPGHLG